MYLQNGFISVLPHKANFMISQTEETMMAHLRACILCEDITDQIQFLPFPLPKNQTYLPNKNLRNILPVTQPRDGPEPVFHSSGLHSQSIQYFSSFYKV